MLLSYPFGFSIVFLTAASAFTIYRDREDISAVSFVLSAYTLVVLFFFSVHRFDSLPPGDVSGRKKVKMAVCMLATAINVLFSWRVSSMMPLAMAVVIWAISLAAAGAGFFLLLCFEEPRE